MNVRSILDILSVINMKMRTPLGECAMERMTWLCSDFMAGLFVMENGLFIQVGRIYGIADVSLLCEFANVSMVLENSGLKVPYKLRRK